MDPRAQHSWRGNGGTEDRATAGTLGNLRDTLGMFAQYTTFGQVSWTSGPNLPSPREAPNHTKKLSPCSAQAKVHIYQHDMHHIALLLEMTRPATAAPETPKLSEGLGLHKSTKTKYCLSYMSSAHPMRVDGTNLLSPFILLFFCPHMHHAGTTPLGSGNSKFQWSLFVRAVITSH